MTDQDTEWALVDAGPPDRLGMDRPQGRYEKQFSDAESAEREAQRLADERGHVLRVIANFFPHSN